MQTNNPKDIYIRQIEILGIKEKKLLQKRNLYAWVRFLSLLVSFIALWKLWPVGILPALAAFIGVMILFAGTVIKDLKNKDAIANNHLLIQLNKEEIAILEHHFSHLPDGLELKPEHHAYANDLDIFGKASLYQYINRSSSGQGNRVLAAWLLNPAEPKTILQRQEASRELTQQVEWRQQFRAFGISHSISILAEQKIGDWLQTPNKFSGKLAWKITAYIFPVITLTILGLFLAGSISSPLFLSIAILFFATGFSISRIIMPHYLQLDKIVPELETLQHSIGWIESSSFHSPLLLHLKKDLSNEQHRASVSIKQLKNILEKFEYRFNPLVHVPLNSFLLWDLHLIMKLEKWKSRHTKNILAWFTALAEMEALSTIATLAFNHPGWSYPVISADRGTFIAEDLGHPLIPIDKRVVNSFSAMGEKNLNLITGSNMAGKSTFLRSVGVNIILAMMGAPTCSSRLAVSPVKVISSMRVNDNLEENTSTFYAELKKLKEIIDAVNKNEKVFLLLDEILRGTNSADRHTGSIALIRQLIRQDACGLIATHDLELARLVEEFPEHLHNYHFDVQVKNEELYFDYKIKEGVCTSMNASLLMKKIGIEL